MSEPLSEERLEEAESLLKRARDAFDDYRLQPAFACLSVGEELLAEVRRLRAVEVQLRRAEQCIREFAGKAYIQSEVEFLRFAADYYGLTVEALEERLDETF